MSNSERNNQAMSSDIAYEHSFNNKKEDNFDQFVNFSPVADTPGNGGFYDTNKAQIINQQQQQQQSNSPQPSITHNLTRPVPGFKVDYDLQKPSSQTDLSNIQEIQGSLPETRIPKIEGNQTAADLFLDDLRGLNSPSGSMQFNHSLQFGQFNQIAAGRSSTHSSNRGISTEQYDTPTYSNDNSNNDISYTPQPPSLTIETPEEIKFTPPPENTNLQLNIPQINHDSTEAEYQQQFQPSLEQTQPQINNDLNFLGAEFSSSALQNIQPSSTVLSEISSTENSPYLSAYSPSHFDDDLLPQQDDNFLDFNTIGRNLNAVDLSDVNSEMSFQDADEENDIQQQFLRNNFRQGIEPLRLTQDNLSANTRKITRQSPVTISIEVEPHDRPIKTPSLFSSPNNSPVHSRAGSSNSQNMKAGHFANLLSPNDTNSSAFEDDSLLKPEDQQHANMRIGRQRRQSRSRSNSRSDERDRSASSSREKMLELASPNQSNKRVQKHPSIYACHLCDKRFTRPYNLKSHLRTHTDERPFVCTVCGKAFARQHDRKRHEDLHTGKKRYECKGFLRDGITEWGCGKKFARTDALGRHLKTEAGKECIRPLVEEHEKEKSENRDGTLNVPNDQVRQFPDEIYNQFPSLLYGSQNNSGTSDVGSDLE